MTTNLNTIKHGLKKPWMIRSAIQLAPAAVVFSALAFTLTMRISYINDNFGDAVNCSHCFTENVVIFDAPFLFALSALFMLSITKTPVLLRIIARLTALFGALLYMGDHIISQNMFTRLQLADISTYGSQVSLIAEHLNNTNFLGLPVLAAMILSGIISLLFVFLPRYSIPTKYSVSGLSLSLLCSAIAFVIPPTVYVHNWAMRNVVSANLTPGVAQEYSAEYRHALPLRPRQTCRAHAPKNDIILLILESWSPYQSALWGGEKNWTPRLDDIAKKNTYFSQFYAAGFSTNEGLASILTGLEAYSPINPFFASTPFQGLWSNTQSTAPRYITDSGYHSAFLTTGNLSFAKKGEWLSNIGFEYVEGHQASFYNGLPRLHFGAAADEHLYARTLAYLDKHKNSGTPLFVTVETVSSHQPFIHPHTRERDIQAVFEYMDSTAADFYQNLDSSGFFTAGGMLIVVSDHRSMTPISQDEQKELGHLAASKIPAFIVFHGAPAVEIDDLAHQADILPTLKSHISGKECTIPDKLNLISGATQQKDRCVFHARGDQRDHIDVICASGSGTIKLAGDNSHFIYSKNLTQNQKAMSLLKLADMRIALTENQKKWSATR